MDILSILLIAFAATADSFIIGLSYGIKKVKIQWKANLFIALCCYAGTLLSMLLGVFLGQFVPKGLTEIFGGLVLLCFGLYMLYSALMPYKDGIRKQVSDPEKVDKDQSKVIEVKESFLVGIMLSLNNIGLGIGAGIAGFSVILMPLLCGVASILFLKMGGHIGLRIAGERCSTALEIISALLVMSLGVGIFF